MVKSPFCYGYFHNSNMGDIFEVNIDPIFTNYFEEDRATSDPIPVKSIGLTVFALCARTYRHTDRPKCNTLDSGG